MFPGHINKKLIFVLAGEERGGERFGEGWDEDVDRGWSNRLLNYKKKKKTEEKEEDEKGRTGGEAKPSVSSSLPECCCASPGPCALCSVLSNKTPALMLENSLQAVNHSL